MYSGIAAAGKMVKITSPEYENSDVYHSLYLPSDWDSNCLWPLIVEYAGNYSPICGCSGEVCDADMGYGLTTGCGFIWVVLPFIKQDHMSNERLWWGDEKATVDYCKINLPRICSSYCGDRSKIYLCGFSRGAIAVNYIGLYDEEISRFWSGFITHDHYDGMREWVGTSWGSPLVKYQTEARKRLKRINGRPALIMQNISTVQIQQMIKKANIKTDNFNYLDVPVEELLIGPSHTTKWLLSDNEYSRKARKWIKEVLNDAD